MPRVCKQCDARQNILHVPSGQAAHVHWCMCALTNVAMHDNRTYFNRNLKHTLWQASNRKYKPGYKQVSNITKHPILDFRNTRLCVSAMRSSTAVVFYTVCVCWPTTIVNAG